jgi:aminomethyltransferase
VGKAALERQKAAGLSRKLIGFTMPDRAFPRHGYAVTCAGAPSGEVRSGTMSPTLGVAIGTAYLPLGLAKEGTEFEVEIRGRRLPAVVQKMPFYKNASHR